MGKFGALEKCRAPEEPRGREAPEESVLCPLMGRVDPENIPERAPRAA